MFKRCDLMVLILAVGLSGLGAGCDSGNDAPAEEPASIDTEEPGGSETNQTAATQVDLTGKWQRATAPSIYKLQHSGTSLQGTYYEPNDTNVSGRIAGTVRDPYVEMDIVVTYTDGVRTNFVAHKSGKILNEDHLRLKVTDSPIALGQVQDWYRR